MQARRRRRDRAFVAREHGLVVAAVALVDRAAAGDIGRQRHVAALGQRLVEHRAVEREREASPRRPRLLPSTVASSWPRKQTRPSSPKRTMSPGQPLAGWTSARQREPSSRLISVAAMAARSSSPRPIRRPCRFAGMTLVSLTTSASPLATAPADRARRGPRARPARPDAPREAARHRAATPAAARCGPRAGQNRTRRCACSIDTARQVAAGAELRLQGPYRNLLRGNQCDGERGHPGQTGHRRRHLAPALRPRHRRRVAGRPGDVSRAAVELRRGTAGRRAERRRNDLFRARRLGGAARP